MNPFTSVQERARASGGTSSDAILRGVMQRVEALPGRGGVIMDVGCGRGDLLRRLAPYADQLIGIDVVAYEGRPPEASFVSMDLNHPTPTGWEAQARVVCAVETIEHLENPRAFFRFLSRQLAPGGCLILTTPNNLSWLSLLTLWRKGQFNAFQDNMYPAHLTALLPDDLRRMAAECRLHPVRLGFTQQGRIPGTGCSWPRVFSALWPVRFSDHMILEAFCTESPS